MDSVSIKTELEDYIAKNARLFRGDDNEVYACFDSNSGPEIALVDSESFRDWLQVEAAERGFFVTNSAFKQITTVINACADLQQRPVCVRIGSPRPDIEFELDLSEGTGCALRVTSEGWSDIEETKVLFPTNPTRCALPLPKKGGSVHSLRDMFDLSHEDEALVMGFLMACLCVSQRYPVLYIVSADTIGAFIFAKYLRDLLDPSKIGIRNYPSSRKELAVTARDNFLLAYKCIGGPIPSRVERDFLTLSQGDAITDCSGGTEKTIFQGSRPIILAGNQDSLPTSELLSRTLVVRLKEGLEQHDPSTAERAKILGVLLEIASRGLSRLANLEKFRPVQDYQLEKWIRACDFAKWDLGAFKNAYKNNSSRAKVDRVSFDPFLLALRAFIESEKCFRGTVSDLLESLNAIPGPKGNRWPSSPEAASRRLRSRKDLLDEIEFDFGEREGRNRNRIMVAKLKSPGEVPQKHAEHQSSAEKPTPNTKVISKISAEIPETPTFDFDEAAGKP